MPKRKPDRRAQEVMREDLKHIRVLYDAYIRDDNPSHGWLNKIRSFCMEKDLGPGFLLSHVARYGRKPRALLSAILTGKCKPPQRRDHADSWQAWVAVPRGKPQKQPSSMKDIIAGMGKYTEYLKRRIDAD